MAKRRRGPSIRPHPPADEEMVRRLALALPGVEERPSYGTPAWRAGGKLFARLHQDGESLVLLTSFAEREALMAADPGTFYITDHYLSYPFVLVRLALVGKGKLRELLEKAWQQALAGG